jgi:hypothetical protein
MKKLFITYIIVSTIAIAFLCYKVFFIEGGNENILRTQGIIIEDKEGNERILIGAPLPYSKDRVFADSVKVKKYWSNHPEIVKYYGSPEDGNSYMERFKKLNSNSNGIVFMNEEGFDRVLVGENLADPNIGNRNGSISGMTWNTKEGFERGGLGVNELSSGEGYRTVIGLDHENGEAIHLVALEDGSKLLRLAYDGGYILIGSTVTNHPIFDVNEPFSGIIIKNAGDSTLFKVNALKK